MRVFPVLDMCVLSILVELKVIQQYEYHNEVKAKKQMVHFFIKSLYSQNW